MSRSPLVVLSIAALAAACVPDSEDDNPFGYTGASSGMASDSFEGTTTEDTDDTDDPTTTDDTDDTDDPTTMGDTDDPTTMGDTDDPTTMGDTDDTSGDTDDPTTTGGDECDGTSPYMGGWDIGCCQDDITPGGWAPGNIGPGTVLPDWTFTDQFGDAVRVWDFCHEAIYFEYVAFW